MPIADQDTYRTDPDRRQTTLSKRLFSPKLMFYPRIFHIIWTNSRKAVRGDYDTAEWVKSSVDILRTLENAGVNIEITGMENIRKVDGPVVFIGNHMSLLETFLLPGIVQPVKPVTFIVKKSLLNTPVFGPIMRSREPVAVGRKNPREDMKTVLEEGGKRLAAGESIIVFPQSTRSTVFDPAKFNTLGIKLALRSGAPVIPLALKTDAWRTGRFIKDFGPLDTDKKVHFAFGGPMSITDRGADEHRWIIRFIQEKLREWSNE